MYYLIELSAIKACLLASFYPLGSYTIRRYASVKWENFLTLLCFSFGIWLGNTTMILCVTIARLYGSPFLFLETKNKWFWILGVLGIWVAIFIKYESLIGRIFIYKNILIHLGEVPLNGFGQEMFHTVYMNWQMNYFQHHNNMLYAKLADAPKYAYNELLQYYIEYGLMPALFLITLYIFNIITFFRTKSNSWIHSILLSSLSILTFGLLSFPLHSIFVIYLFCALQICLFITLLNLSHRWIITALIILLSSCSWQIIRNQSYEESWIYTNSIPPIEISDKINGYQEIESKFSKNPYYLKDFASYLLLIKSYNELIGLTTKHRSFFNQYDRLLIIGQAYMEQAKYREAISRFDSASYMIPNRFTPVFYSMKTALIYKDTSVAQKYARRIILMPIKIPSAKINLIRKEASNLLDSL